jgi:hypothetical protein
MSPVTPTDPADLKRQYPHVNGVTDWRAEQSLRLLWDRVFDLEARLQGIEATQRDLTGASNQQEANITRVDRQSMEALALAQRTPIERGVTDGTGGGDGSPPGDPGPATGPGSKADPIIPMSDDPAITEGNIKASLYHWNRADYGYWSRAIHADGSTPLPWQGGDNKWYLGWDAYMEARAEPGAGPSAPHSLLPLPAVYTTPPPSGYPTGGWIP